MSDGLFSALELDSPGSHPGYRLHQVEIFNWGTFDQFVWQLTPGGETSLLTGDIGSGKSTLVDAVTTLLLPANKISYNKAAGADTKERMLRSYVEGHYRSERNEATGTSRPVGLRQDSSTYSVILGVFTNEGYDETVTIAQVFQQRERAGQPYRFFLTAGKALSVGTDFSDFGSDLNDLRRRLRGSDAEIFDDYPKYATSLRRRLGIHSEQALELFHQTVSMKSVGNLNEFVRDHMLEPADGAGRVRGIIGHFEDLTASHALVIRAREQLEALAPVVAAADRYDAATAERDQLEAERSAVLLFIAELRRGLLDREIEQYNLSLDQLDRTRESARTTRAELSATRDALLEQRARSGGDRIGDLERIARESIAEAEARGRQRAVFDQALETAGLPPITGADGFAAILPQISEQTRALAGQRPAIDAAYAEALSQVREVQSAITGIDAELASLEQRTSNLPLSVLDVREQLSTALDLTSDDLPFAGELLDVAVEHEQWRGAAERVLHGFALSLLVPQAHYEAVSQWVNTNRVTFRGRGGDRVGAKLVYERVADRRIRLQRSDSADLLADRIAVKDGPFAEYLRSELARRADYVCATTLTQFREEHRAVTQQGQVRSGDRHTKDDRSAVSDPRTWVLGWSNELKIAALRTELKDQQSELDAANQRLQIAEERHAAIRLQESALQRLSGFSAWADLDVQASLDRAQNAEEERSRLEAGSSRLQEITTSLERAQEALATIGTEIDALTGTIAATSDRRDRATAARKDDEDFVAAQPADTLEAVRSTYGALARRLGEPPTDSGHCAAAQSRLTDDLDRLHRGVTNQIASLNGHLVQAMHEVLRRWPDLRSDLDATVETRNDFRALHTSVQSDDLPRFEAEFKRQLNTNTIHELAGFNTWLKQQADDISERVARINEALGAIDYSPGRYIRLETKATTNQDVQTFRADLRHATDDAIGPQDDAYSEQRFLQVQAIIERFRGREGFADSDKNWTRRVTDVRNWFTFSASERDRQTDAEWEHYTDSDGKSGGQKEKLAYTILAASLAYQFGLEWGVTKSRDFRFAVIDEAFGRGSDTSTRYALDLFAKLGLQLLIVTPLQKVRVIEPYVRTIGFVANPTGMRSTVHTLSIEEFHERREGR